MTFNLNKPEGRLTQPFGVNYNSSYKDSGLVGHTGEDYVVGYLKPIKACIGGEVYGIRKPTNPDRYSAVYQIIDLPTVSYEVSYGHLSGIGVKEGDKVRKGQIIGLEGNYGLSYSNGKLVTKEEKSTGKGSHLHFQVRLCKRVPKRTRGKHYLRNSAKYLQRDGMYYEVIDYDNGYNGCVSPALFYQKEDNILVRILRLLKSVL